MNFHQLNLNRSPLPPVNFRKRSCFPLPPLTVQVFVVHDEVTYLVQGRFEPEALSEKLGIEFPEEHGRTLGGFVANSLGKIPKAGEWFDYRGYRFCVSRMAQRRVAHVIVQRLKEAEPTSSAELADTEEGFL